jgi:hypothetical protein
MSELAGNVTIVTGASRDIGAEIARAVAAEGGHLVIGCREKLGRAQEVAEDIHVISEGRSRVEVVSGDLTDDATTEQMIERAVRMADETHGQLASLVMSAAGGFGRTMDEARDLNRYANIRLARLFDEAVVADEAFDERTLLFMQSTPSHFLNHPGMAHAVEGDYAPVATTKYEAEADLRDQYTDGNGSPDRRLLVLCGDAIEGTFVTRMLARQYKRFTDGGDLIADRNEQMEALVGSHLPDAQQFGGMAVRMLMDHDLPSGHITFMPRPILQSSDGQDFAAEPTDLSFGVGVDPALYSFVNAEGETV